MRHFVDFINLLRKQWLHLYGAAESATPDIYNAHIQRLKETVPEDRLFFFSVKDGWGPLCKALGKEVPDMPFPNINDGEAIERFSKMIIKRGLMRWVIIFITLGIAIIPFFFVKV